MLSATLDHDDNCIDWVLYSEEFQEKADAIRSGRAATHRALRSDHQPQALPSLDSSR
jgi:hypothetical protein